MTKKLPMSVYFFCIHYGFSDTYLYQPLLTLNPIRFLFTIHQPTLIDNTHPRTCGYTHHIFQKENTKNYFTELHTRGRTLLFGV